jgi:hypothetical protein
MIFDYIHPQSPSPSLFSLLLLPQTNNCIFNLFISVVKFGSIEINGVGRNGGVSSKRKLWTSNKYYYI